jgi:Tfp pilus assembly protein PilV
VKITRHKLERPSPRPSPRGRGSRKHRQGGALIFALVTLLVVTLMTGTLVRALVMEIHRSRQAANELQTQWLSEAAVERAAAQVRANPEYQGESWQPVITDSQGADVAAIAEIRIENDADNPKRVQITIDTRYPDHPLRRVAVQRSYILTPAKRQPSPGEAREEKAL